MLSESKRVECKFCQKSYWEPDLAASESKRVECKSRSSWLIRCFSKNQNLKEWNVNLVSGDKLLLKGVSESKRVECKCFQHAQGGFFPVISESKRVECKSFTVFGSSLCATNQNLKEWNVNVHEVDYDNEEECIRI